MKNKNRGALLTGILWILMLAGGCRKTESNLPVKTGQSYQGGIVAYILQPGDKGYSATTQHGLIAAPADQSTGVQWYNGNYVATGASGDSIGTGKSNTDLIIAKQGTGSYAASICASLTLGGYNDWYLPSKDELNELFTNRTLIGGFDNTANYWSSTEEDAGLAWYQYFSATGGNFADKYDPANVRAIRSF